MNRLNKIVIMLALMLSILGVGYAANVQIGTGTQTFSYLPVGGQEVEYSYSQQIYRKAEIVRSGEIYKLRFYYSMGDIGPQKDWTIYLGHTDKTEFSSTTDWVPYSSLTKVFEGDVTHMKPQTNGQWMEIPLQTPFNYNNTDNLVVAVLESTPCCSAVHWGSFNNTGTGGDRSIYYHGEVIPDPANPGTATNTETVINRIQLVFPDNVAPSAPILSGPDNDAEVYTGQRLRWSLPAGSADVTGYDVYINGVMVSENHPIASYPITESIDAGTHTWYVVARNSGGTSAASETRSFTLFDEARIGRLTNRNSRYPFNVASGYARSLSLYTYDQIGNSGLLESLSWYVSTAQNTAVPYKIYAKLTDDTSLKLGSWNSFINSGPTLVGEGSHTFDTTGWHQIDLSKPFVYTGDKNLLIGVETAYTGVGAGSGNFPLFNHFPSGGNTHHYWYSDNINDINIIDGSLDYNLPNMHIKFNPSIINPTQYDFGDVMLDDTQSKTFTITNIYGTSLEVTSVSPSSIGAFTVIGAPASPMTLAPGQSITFTVQFSPTALGNQGATFNINTIINGQPATTTLTVRGNGTDPSTTPVTLSHFSATLTAQNYVQLSWTSQSESNLMGYNVLRNNSLDLSTAKQISAMIAGTNTSEAHSYTYYDEELVDSGTYYYWLQSVDMDGSFCFHGPVSVVFSIGGEGGSPSIPTVTRLENAFPNPFNPNTTIRYQLKDPGRVKIDIYNQRGQIVHSFEQSHAAAGYYGVNWDGCDSSGKALPSGVYLYKMSSGSYKCAKKLVLQK